MMNDPKPPDCVYGWLREVWGKWPGDEPIEALLDALNDDDGEGE